MSSFNVVNTTSIPIVLPEIPTQGTAPTGGVFTSPTISVDNEGRIRTIEEGQGATVSLPAGSLHHNDPANPGSLAGKSFLAYNSLGTNELQLNTANATLPTAFGEQDTFMSGRHLTLGCNAGRRIDFNRNNSGSAADCSWGEGIQITNPGNNQTFQSSLVQPVIAIESDLQTYDSKLTFFKGSSTNPQGFTNTTRPQLTSVPTGNNADVIQNAEKINDIIKMLQKYGLVK